MLNVLYFFDSVFYNSIWCDPVFLTDWLVDVFGFNLSWLVHSRLPSDDARLFGFLRITTGDAMSKRAKFTLITWIGESISGLQRAKISTDKTLVKDIVQVSDWRK